MKVTLDIDDPRTVALWVRKCYNISFEAPNYLRDVANQLEAQAPPVRMKEPGLWGVVASEGDDGITSCRWVRDEIGWVSINGSYSVRVSGFDILVEPVLIREGLPA